MLDNVPSMHPLGLADQFLFEQLVDAVQAVEQLRHGRVVGDVQSSGRTLGAAAAATGTGGGSGAVLVLDRERGVRVLDIVLLGGVVLDGFAVGALGG